MGPLGGDFLGGIFPRRLDGGWSRRLGCNTGRVHRRFSAETDERSTMPDLDGMYEALETRVAVPELRDLLEKIR